MYVRPNSNAKISEAKQKNDLFRKFRDYFISAAEKEFNQFGSYSREGYISVNLAIEERIKDTLDHNIDEILPITGATGIGKTYLLLYCLKCFYDVDDIATNHPQLLEKNGVYDLVYYSDFNITEPTILEDSSQLVLAKIKAMYERLLSHFDVSEPDVDNYINSHKLEAKFYSKTNTIYQKELYKLTALLNMSDVTINNIVFIFDDLESLTEEEQFSLMKNFLTLFENFKCKSNGKFHSKFIFCLRSNTYYNIYKRDFYNTHRASKASCLIAAPSLSQVFKKRFNIILKSDQVKKANNIDTWKTARVILIKICDRVDSSYSDLLLKLNNDNVSNALDDFLNIVSNRRWTQKNVNPAVSFIIEENHYYINDTNILRILSMGERDVYYQTPSTSIRCILPDPGVNDENDLLTFLILQAFQHNSHSARGDIITLSELLSDEEVAEKITSCLLTQDEEMYKSRKQQVETIVQNAFAYYEENRFIRKNVDPEIRTEKRKYFLLPRGEQIFHLFFSQSILFTIIRDAFLWNDKEYDTRCSNYMSFAELLNEAIKYEKHLIVLETRLFEKITQNGMWRNYISFFGAWSVSESFYKGIRKSVHQYYKDKRDPVPDEINQELRTIKENVEGLISVFDKDHEEVKMF